MGERNWFQEEKFNTATYGNYGFSDNLLGNEDNFGKSDAAKWLTTLPQDIHPTFRGAYG